MTWEELNELNNKNRRNLTRQSAIQIRKTYEDSTVAGKFINVIYADYGMRCEDSAPLNDIIGYLKYGEKYITNIGALVEYCDDVVTPPKDTDELVEQYIESGKQKLKGKAHEEFLKSVDAIYPGINYDENSIRDLEYTDDDMPYGWREAKQKVESLGGEVLQIKGGKLQIKLNEEVNWYPPAYIMNRL